LYRAQNEVEKVRRKKRGFKQGDCEIIVEAVYMDVRLNVSDVLKGFVKQGTS
jgi:hypothetical protein